MEGNRDACQGLFAANCRDGHIETYNQSVAELEISSIEQEHRQRLDEIDSRRDEDNREAESRYRQTLTSLQQERRDLSRVVSTQTSQDESQLGVRLESIRQERERAIEAVVATYAIDRAQVSGLIEDQNDRRGEINELVERRDEINSNILQRRQEFDAVANQDQIYQIAKLAFGVRSASQVTEPQLRTVVLIWFGSLAVIVACTGIVLALGSMVLKYERKSSSESLWKNFGKVFFYFLDFSRYLPKSLKSLRAMAVSARKRWDRKPKIVERTVTKEVPVEKVVTKKVEVPVTVTKKEFVYVPFYSTDKEDIENLKQQLDDIDKR